MNSHPGYRLFRDYTVPQLAELLPYEPIYLHHIKIGNKPATRRLRRVVARILGKDESYWFSTNGTENK